MSGAVLHLNTDCVNRWSDAREAAAAWLDAASHYNLRAACDKCPAQWDISSIHEKVETLIQQGAGWFIFPLKDFDVKWLQASNLWPLNWKTIPLFALSLLLPWLCGRWDNYARLSSGIAPVSVIFNVLRLNTGLPPLTPTHRNRSQNVHKAHVVGLSWGFNSVVI